MKPNSLLPLFLALILPALTHACINPGHPQYADLMARAHLEDFLKSLAKNFPESDLPIGFDPDIAFPTPPSIQDIDTSLFTPDTDFPSLSHEIATDPNFWPKRVEQLHNQATDKNAPFEITNEYASALILTGKYSDAIKILKKQERQTPDHYETATNLGTAYELVGDLKNAKKWIQAGITRNPGSHQGTEWLHANILDAKQALKKNPRWLEKNLITPIERTALTPASIEKTQKAIVIQLSERLVFVPAPDPIVASLFYELGKLYESQGEVQNAEIVYHKSIEFGPLRTAEITAAREQRDFKTTYQHLLISARSEVYRPAIDRAAQSPNEDCCRHVRALGKTLTELDLTTVTSVESISYNDSQFWMALMQMSPDNQLVESILTSLFIANGELDKARRITTALEGFTYAQGINPNFGNQSMRLLSAALDDFYKLQAERIEKGIQLHDTGQNKAAIQIYQTVTDVFPKSVWANWEIALSSPDFLKNTLHAQTSEATQAIQALDPLFMIGGNFSGQRQIAQMLLRMQLRDLHRQNLASESQYYKIAENALLLEQYGLAALLYWKGAQTIKHPTLPLETLLARYLYSIQKLGHPQILENFTPAITDQIPDVQTFIDATYAASPGR